MELRSVWIGLYLIWKDGGLPISIVRIFTRTPPLHIKGITDGFLDSWKYVLGHKTMFRLSLSGDSQAKSYALRILANNTLSALTDRTSPDTAKMDDVIYMMAIGRAPP